MSGDFSLQRQCRGSLRVPGLPDDGTQIRLAIDWARKRKFEGDRYGLSSGIASFETHVASLLGYPAGCFMPTGVMAQLIALRVHADRSGRSCVGIHPSSHHLVEEHNSLQVLHALEPRQLCPWERPIRAVDITGASNNLAAVSVELPIRWIGGQMQSWQELTEIKDACVRLGIALHVDGARLWECQPGLGRSLKDICSGCSSVYVSFYKSIGATGGAMLVGQTDFIAEARLWRRRHGGDIFQLWPYVASAEMRMERALERMPSDFARAGRWAKMLGESGVAVTPSIPQTPMFHICARADVATVIAKRDEIARDVRIWVTGWIKQVSNQEFVAAEIQPGPWSDALTDEEAVAAMVTLTE